MTGGKKVLGGVSIASAVLLLAMAGCGSKGFKTAPVKGTVTVAGKPAVQVFVQFQPVAQGDKDAGPSSTAVTDANGNFELRLVGAGSAMGAVVGEHAVRLAPAGEKETTTEGEPAPIVPLPPKATDGSYRVTVPPEGLADVKLEF
ncbi:transthyretin-like family protein [Thermopirellula anaerolimosa]